MKKIKYLDIVYENCDSHRLTPDMFVGLGIEGITKRYWINCFQYENGEVYEMIDCSKFFILINKKGMEIKNDLADDTLAKRIKKWKDITHINLEFEDGHHEYIAVPWRGEYMENELQKVKKNKDLLEIIIKSAGNKL